MSRVHEIRLRPRGPFREPPRAPGLFGHLAWAVRYRHGPDAVRQWLEPFRTQPPFLLSSAFPTGFLPYPTLPPIPVPDTTLRKRLKAMRYIPIEVFADVIGGGTTALLEHAQAQEGDAPRGWLPAGRTRVTIDRATGGALEGQLFTDTHQWYEAPRTNTLSVYLRGPQAACHEVLELLRDVARTGYGGSASTGMGSFEVDDAAEVTLEGARDPTHAVSLAPVLPRAGMTGWWHLEAYWGRMGGHYGSEAKPFKRPHLRVREGATLDANTRGGMLDVTPHPPPEPGVTIWDYLYAFPVGIRVKDQA